MKCCSTTKVTCCSMNKTKPLYNPQKQLFLQQTKVNWSVINKDRMLCNKQIFFWKHSKHTKTHCFVKLWQVTKQNQSKNVASFCFKKKKSRFGFSGSVVLFLKEIWRVNVKNKIKRTWKFFQQKYLNLPLKTKKQTKPKVLLIF